MRFGIHPATTTQRKVAAAAASFDPASLSPSLWYRPADLTTQFKTGPVAAAVGEAIAQSNDKSGNSKHFLQATSNKQPILSQSGSTYYWAFDGSNDGLSASSLTLPADADVFMLVNHNVSDIAWIDAFSGAAGSKYLGCGENGQATTNYGGAGTPTTAINGTAIGNTRDNYFDALTGAGWKVVEFRNANLSTWTTFQIGDYDATYAPLAGIAGLWVGPALTTNNRNSLRTAMGADVGLTI